MACGPNQTRGFRGQHGDRVRTWDICFIPVGVGSLWEAFYVSSRLATLEPCKRWEACGKPFLQVLNWLLLGRSQPRICSTPNQSHFPIKRHISLNSMAATRIYTILKYPRIHKESFGIGFLICSSECLLGNPQALRLRVLSAIPGAMNKFISLAASDET
jgi:hypothetical protein